MDLNKYYVKEDDNFFFTQQQASDFAKNIAGDFNPIHDVGSKKFIVPGDLLFSLVVQRFGLRKKMHFNFSGMVRDNTRLYFSAIEDNKVSLLDENKKEYLDCTSAGGTIDNQEIISDFSQAYVSFSAKGFPHLLIPLMKESNVMINAARPLIIYQSMSLELDHLDLSEIKLIQHKTTLDVTGKRGRACFQFDILSSGKKVGCGEKYMILTGLREYDQHKVDKMVKDYQQIVLAH